MAKALASPVGDEELRTELKKLGFEAGPITDTTRRVYSDKLKQLKTKTSKKPAHSSDRLTESETPPVETRCCEISSESAKTTTAFVSRETDPPSSLPLPRPPVSSTSTDSVVSGLLQTLNNSSHLASDTAFLFPDGGIFLASRAILSTQCHNLLPILYNREDLFVVNVSTLSGHTSRFFVRPTELVVDLKEKISLVEAVPVPGQRLFFNQSELGNKTRFNQTGIGDGSVVHLVVTPPAPCQPEQQQTMYFTSSVSPSLSIHHLYLGLGLDRLIPMGGASPSLRPPRLPLPPHICHIVHMYDVPHPAWAAFVHYLYSQQLREDSVLEVCVCCHVLGERFGVPNLCHATLQLIQQRLTLTSTEPLLQFADSINSDLLRQVCLAHLKIAAESRDQ